MSGDMDPAVWSRLPQEVLLDVLARLPYNYIPKLREVCKNWKALIVAKHFTDRIVTVRYSQNPFLLLCVKRYQAIVAYNPVLKEWREIFIWKKAPKFRVHSLLASGGGLLCFLGNLGKRKQEDGEIRLLVSNPITKLWRILPSLPPGTETDGSVNVLVLENEPHHFKILFTQIYGPRRHRQLVGTLYESALDTWTKYTEATTLDSIYRGAYVKGCMHYIGSARVLENGARVSRKQGVTFNLQTKRFSRFEAPLTSDVGVKKFMELHDALSIVTFSTLPTHTTTVQQLDEPTTTWVEVKRLPAGTSLGIEGHVCLGQGSFLYFADPHRLSRTIVVCDLLHRAWFHIDDTKSDLRSEGYKLYHPSLCSV